MQVLKYMTQTEHLVQRNDIRNVAIIAHVDHGKTTLVDGLLKQSHIFRENQQVGELIMDSNDQERERGITILAKNTAIIYRGIKINIIDTPGHADFGGEVERVLNMADGCILLIDAVEGPMPQTRFVLQKALELNLQPIVVINKIDRRDARIDQVFEWTQDLFLELATTDAHLNFPVLYAIGRDGVAMYHSNDERRDLEPLFETITKPTLKMTFSVNTSPFAGREGKSSTSRQLRARLYRELETNVSLRVEDGNTPDEFIVSGRGELHLSVLIETMRREGYEFQVSRPEVITREDENGTLLEPIEHLVIDTRDTFIGVLTETLAARKAQLTNMTNDGSGNVRLEYHIPTRGLIGFRNAFLTLTQGNGAMSSLLVSYEPWLGKIGTTRMGALIASETGVAVTYGLNNAQQRGDTFIEPGTPVYEGMIIGLSARPMDMAVNVCKEQQKTNVRSSTSDIAVRLTPPIIMSLEQSLDFINTDELVEVTPQNIRLRKRLLTQHERSRARSNE